MSHTPKRHRILTTISKLSSHLYHTTTLFHLLRRLLSKSLRLVMDFAPLYDGGDTTSDFTSNLFFDRPSSFTRSSPFFDPGESLYLVPFRWWEDAVLGSGRVLEDGVMYNASVAFNGDMRDAWDSFGDSEIVLDMRNQGEVGVSGRGKEIQGDRLSAGGDLALVTEWMYFTALKWHYDNKNVGNSRGGNRAHDLFSLQIRLAYVLETNLLVIKIMEKDNDLGAFNSACRIFCSKSGTLQIWDFSGQTKQVFLDDEKQYMESDKLNGEITLELQIYVLSCSIKEEASRNECLLVDQSVVNGPSSSFSSKSNDCMDEGNLFPAMKPSFPSGSGYCGTSDLGLTGLFNLGNTCFMNSAIQCLVHTPKLVDYFLWNFRKDLNIENPLGMNGKLAIAFGDLLRKLWAAAGMPIYPNLLKSTISSFSPQFSGYNQHDSQEFLAFLLDGLHEDLNRVKSKPYIETKDEDGRQDEDVADEYWGNHLSRNDSIIVDLCQGQFRSTVLCPICKKLSITFDPFMYLSLPLPPTILRTMTLTVVSCDGTSTDPIEVTVKVSNNGTLKDLVAAVSDACALKDDETLVIAEIYNNSIFRLLEDPNDALDLIRDADVLVAYKLPKDDSGSPLVAFIHQQEMKVSIHPFPSSHKMFAVPLLARISDFSKGSKIDEVFQNLLTPYYIPSEDFSNSDDEASEKTVATEENVGIPVVDKTGIANLEKQSQSWSDFEYHLEMSRLSKIKIEMEEPVHISDVVKPIKVIVTWRAEMKEEYQMSCLSKLPEVYKPELLPQLAQDSITLGKCLEAFLKEEPLGPEDMWYCPNCKEHRQASKKLDLWRLPEILVIHLKRFSYNSFFKDKLETFVDFPVDNFDISNYVTHKNDKVSCRYVLYAVSNHYGSMGGGHYTAFVKHEHRWYDFDDSRVNPVAEDQIKTRAAYVLFYRRV